MFWCFLIGFRWVISIVVVCLSASPSFSQLEYLGSSWTNTAIWRWWVGTHKKLPMNSITQHQLNTLFPHSLVPVDVICLKKQNFCACLLGSKSIFKQLIWLSSCLILPAACLANFGSRRKYYQSSSKVQTLLFITLQTQINPARLRNS